jgi:hypothetical protein
MAGLRLKLRNDDDDEADDDDDDDDGDDDDDNTSSLITKWAPTGLSCPHPGSHAPADAARLSFTSIVARYSSRYVHVDCAAALLAAAVAPSPPPP